MNDEDRIAAATARYRIAAHAVQSGVAMEMQRGVEATSPKHLRTGLDLRASDAGGLVRLLIDKRVFSEAEYLEYIASFAEQEQKAYEDRLSASLGAKITLG